MNSISHAKVYVQDQIQNYDQLIKGYHAGEFGEIFGVIKKTVRPGDRVVLKPNLVKHCHLFNSDEWEQVITHPAIIECALLETLSALQGSGSVAIIDAPQADADFDEILRVTKLNEVIQRCQANSSTEITLFDLREEKWIERGGIIVGKKKLQGDPAGYVSIDLGDCSEFVGKINKSYYGADYDTEETRRYHNEDNNIYVFSRTVLNADVFVNLPKMKTHKLAGITGCAKNIVGVCIVKNSLPHHTIGTPDTNGDQFEKSTLKAGREKGLKTLANKLLRYKSPIISYPFILAKKIAGLVLGGSETETVRNGSWHGNDTIWRAVLDLNKILLYADKSGQMRDVPQRRYCAIMDGIVAGEGKGPLSPDVKEAGVLIAGYNPIAVDTVEACLMGFDPLAIPVIKHAFSCVQFPVALFDYEGVAIISNNASWNKKILQIAPADTLLFKPHFGWEGKIEVGRKL